MWCRRPRKPQEPDSEVSSAEPGSEREETAQTSVPGMAGWTQSLECQKAVRLARAGLRAESGEVWDLPPRRPGHPLNSQKEAWTAKQQLQEAAWIQKDMETLCKT